MKREEAGVTVEKGGGGPKTGPYDGCLGGAWAKAGRGGDDETWGVCLLESGEEEGGGGGEVSCTAYTANLPCEPEHSKPPRTRSLHVGRA